MFLKSVEKEHSSLMEQLSKLDINFLVRTYSKEYLKSIGLKWGYSPSKGYYIGFKTTVMMEYDNAKPVMILFHPGSPNDSKLFDEIMEEARRRKIIHQKDTIIFDKDYYSYKNYQKGIIKYKIVPFIFPKNNFNKNNLKKLLNYPLEIFDAKKDTKSTILKYISITKELFKKLYNWKKYKPIRGKIEDFFKLCKKGPNMKKIHSYTRESAFKNTILNVFLAGLITAQGYDSKQHYNSYPKTKKSSTLKSIWFILKLNFINRSFSLILVKLIISIAYNFQFYVYLQ